MRQGFAELEREVAAGRDVLGVDMRLLQGM